jgi:hypothetical protein
VSTIVSPPDDAGPEERAEYRELEQQRFTVSPTPDELHASGVHGYTRPEIEAITAALDTDRRLSRSARLLLSRPRIYGEYLLRYAASSRSGRTPGRARNAIRATAEHDVSHSPEDLP